MKRLASVDRQLESLKKKAQRNNVEVEDLLHIAVSGEAKAAPVLRALKNEYAWPEKNRSGRNLVVPLGGWVTLVCLYLEFGFDGVINHILAENCSSDERQMAIGVLEEIQTIDSAKALIRLANAILPHMESDLALAKKIVSAFNLLLSFKPDFQLGHADELAVRRFVIAFLARAISDAEIACAYCALRGVGDEECIKLIKERPDLNDPWADTAPNVIAAIRKNLKRRSAQ